VSQEEISVYLCHLVLLLDDRSDRSTVNDGARHRGIHVREMKTLLCSSDVAI